MKKSMLLPHGFQKIGWAILIPTALLGVLMWIDDFNGIPSYLCPGVRMNIYDPGYAFCHSETTTRLLNNVALIGTILGSIFVTCSRNRIEDEMIGKIRLNALLTALYINFGCMIVAALTLYDLAFLNMMVYNLTGLPLLFLLIYQWRLWRLRKMLKDEE